jgi:hypothetical protein
VGKQGLQPGLRIAEGAYGGAVRRVLAQSLNAFPANRAHWLESLQVADTRTLNKGLRILRTLAAASPRVPS